MENLKEILEREVLPFVDKPARYIGGEINQIVKSDKDRTRIALIYPDVYEIGISNLGLKILYHQLNKKEEFFCERAYSPWTDMEKYLRELQLPAFSLETHRPLREFDVLGFSFQYELLYTNFLNLLDLSGIAFESASRSEEDPLIIAGGPASANLEPIADFLDAVCLGDGESRIVEMCEVIHEAKQQKLSRKEILLRLSDLSGVYVPSLYREEEGEFVIPKGPPVNRFIEADLNEIDFPVRQIVPLVKAVQDRAVVEAARGCVRGCRFCQAGMTYRPVRERSVSEIVKLAQDIVLATGYRELSLISLSISDYSQLISLIRSLHEVLTPHGISFSLPSLRLDSFTLELAQKVREIRKSGLTFAVEGGTQLLRDRMNKGVTEQELMTVIGYAAELGWKSVKLYFMIGMPQPEGQEEDETEGIIQIVNRITAAYPRMGITVSVALFVPKPHTPYQWAEMKDPEWAGEQFRRLKHVFRRNRKVSIRYNDSRVSWLEGVMSRGDRKLSEVILKAFRMGARFDGWDEFYDRRLWVSAFESCGIDPSLYLKARGQDELLPWQLEGLDLDMRFLKREFEKSERAELTVDCRAKCVSCGVCDFKKIRHISSEKAEAEKNKDFLSHILIKKSEKIGVVRFIMKKVDEYRYLNPIDFEEHVSRSLVRANLPVKFTVGFNPHIRVQAAWALPVGFASVYEVLQVEINDEICSETWIQALNAVLPYQTQVLEAKVLLGEQTRGIYKSARRQKVIFELDVPPEKDFLKIKELTQGDIPFLKVTPKRQKEINIRDYLYGVEDKNGRFQIAYRQEEGGARIQDVIRALIDYDVRQAVALKPMLLARFALGGKDGKEEISLLDV